MFDSLFNMFSSSVIYEYFGYSAPSFLIFITNAIVFYIIIKLIYWLFKNVFLLVTSKTKTHFDDDLAKSLEKPLLVSILIVFLISQINFFFKNAIVNLWSLRIGVSLIIIMATIFLYDLIGLVYKYVLVPISNKTDSYFDDQLFPIVRKALRVVLLAFSAVYILSWYGVEIGPLLAGIGIGGLALAFAAQKVLGDIFGGVAIFSDQPFKMGDVVKTSDTTGVIKEVGLRSTRITTFDGTEVVVPNSIIANDSVENISKRKMRKEMVTLGVEYSTSTKKLEDAKKIITKILKSHKSVDDNFYVYFDQFADSSLNINVVYWITDLAYADYITDKDEINFSIKKEFEKAKIEFAYPSQTLYLKK